jgi:hypothetical protein
MNNRVSNEVNNRMNNKVDKVCRVGAVTAPDTMAS